MPVDQDSLNLPASAGVYLFKTKAGKVLYVGKATDLRSRTQSYFASNPDREMIPHLVAEADHVDFIITPTPSEALVVERQLIQEHRPRFNSQLKDDKSYPFLALTADEHPQILYTRNPPSDALTWGPFPHAGGAKQLFTLLRREFGLRDCKTLLPQGCLSMHIGLCHGPCLNPEGYDEKVRAARKVLDGDANELLDGLLSVMDDYSQNMEFEKAAQTRDLIASIRQTLSHHVVSSRFYQDTDAVGFAARRDDASVTILHATDGVVQAQEVHYLIHRGDVSETIGRCLATHYHSRRPPQLLLVPSPFDEQTKAWLKHQRVTQDLSESNVSKKGLEIRVPARGELATLRKLADQNAAVQLERYIAKKSGSLERRAVDDCQKLLEIESLDQVVAFDMAQLQGFERVGVAVSLQEGRPDKDNYRQFIVKDEAAHDDISMMKEVVLRWLKRQTEWPDLVLLDGGKTHLDAIARLIESEGLGDRFRLMSLAKREETLHRLDGEPIVLGREGRLLVFARDEAHRFVNTFHRKRRGKRGLKDPLEGVTGMGAKKLQALLRHFGGRRGVEKATIEDLCKVPGIGKRLATEIHNTLK